MANLSPISLRKSRRGFKSVRTPCPPSFHVKGFLTTHDALRYIMCGCLKKSLHVHTYMCTKPKCLYEHHAPKCVSCLKVIVVITGKTH